MHNSDEYVFELLSAGAKGYIIKQAAPNELISAIKEVFRGLYLFKSRNIQKGSPTG